MSDASAHAAHAGEPGHAVHAVSEFEHAQSKLGMWLFLASEVMFFSGLIGAYIVLRMGGTKEVFDGSVLNWKLAAVNTVALLASSLTMALAISAIRRDDIHRAAINIFLTISLGGVFLIIKAIEYSTKFLHHITPGTNVFYSCYFTMTGFHGIHVLAGLIVLGVLLVRILQGRYSSKNYTVIENTGLYWHLVDVVWIFLFPILYLL